MSTTVISKRAAVAAALLLLGGAAWLTFAPAPWGGPPAVEFGKETIGIETAAGLLKLDAELAVTPAQQAHGLMFRTSLADGHGMLFLHKEPRDVHMWMKNTYIPLDMVFIRPDGRIHRIEARTEPLSERVIGSQGVVGAVLELPAGAAGRMGLKPGDKVLHPHFSGAAK